MEKKVNQIILIIAGFVAAIVAGLVMMLIIETHFFVQHTRDLVRLKEDYANYTLALKRIITTSKQDQAEPLGSKKKKISSDDEFVIVSRDFNYLFQSALSYARDYHLEDSVAQLYKSRDWKMSASFREARGPRLRKRQQAHVLALDNGIMALRAEHPFVYPLVRGSFHFTSRFGPRRRANGSWGFHYGLDMAAPKGTPVKAVAHGVVIEARHTTGFGNTVLISHSNKLKTRYAHLSKIDVKVGDAVEQGQQIGRVGNTGHTRGKNGIHLHFEVLVYGKQINPSYFL